MALSLEASLNELPSVFPLNLNWHAFCSMRVRFLVVGTLENLGRRLHNFCLESQGAVQC